MTHFAIHLSVYIPPFQLVAENVHHAIWYHNTGPFSNVLMDGYRSAVNVDTTLVVLG